MAKERGKKIQTNPLDSIVKPQGERPATKQGLKDEYTRATLIVREDYMNTLKNVAYTDRMTLKDLMEKVMGDYIAENVNTREDVIKKYD